MSAAVKAEAFYIENRQQSDSGFGDLTPRSSNAYINHS